MLSRLSHHISFPAVFALLVVAAAVPVVAEEDARALPAPELPAPIEEGALIEPGIIIIEQDDGQVVEYRVNGRLYMIKMTPIMGPAYYILDEDGDGHLESVVDNLHQQPAVPQWLLFSW